MCSSDLQSYHAFCRALGLTGPELFQRLRREGGAGACPPVTLSLLSHLPQRLTPSGVDSHRLFWRCALDFGLRQKRLPDVLCRWLGSLWPLFVSLVDHRLTPYMTRLAR